MPQVRFALCSSPVFSRTDTATDSETFYQSLLELLDDPDEAFEVDELMVWWNRCVHQGDLCPKLALNDPISTDRYFQAILPQKVPFRNIARLPKLETGGPPCEYPRNRIS